ncbi:MAG: glycoside hydrolase family 3 C-terminal domain-containing protein [Lachnospiraceae bacterium]|nr:glycoside hydrolase family 3 C-terminal domain-containing protein [Lachnospiraceae bacterium]
MEIKEIIKNLTLEEKALLVGGADAWNTVAVERVGIPAVRVSDGPHGLRKTDHLMDGEKTVQAVCFPSGAGLASSFNRDLIYHLGTVLGRECKGESVNVLLGPAINIKRSPLCGRNFEYMSEDPYLAGQIASAYVKGVQSEGVGVSLKHFAANNQEKRRMTVSAVIDERTLREIYLAAFEEVVKTAKPDTLMCSYNKINGVYSSENPWLLNKVLRDEWGFDGLVMSDWGAVNNRPEGVKAGLDLEMPSSNGINAEKVKESVMNGELDEKYLDLAVEHVLKLVDKYTGFAANVTEESIINYVPEETSDACGCDKAEDGNTDNVQAEECEKTESEQEAEAQTFDRIADHKEARKIARECMVLLKNEGALPLKKEQNILFVGEFAKKPRIQGGGSSHINCTRIISALQASTRHTKVMYSKGFSSTEDVIDEKLAADAKEKAAQADVVVIFAGLPDSFESEGYDRKHMRLPQCQNRLIREIAAIQSNTVVVLHNGSPVSMPWVSNVNAILEAYLGGEASGEAVVDILFGKVNPSGKLAETFPVGIKDTPCYNYFPGNRLTVEYREGLFTGYRYYDKVNAEVLFPFGHGLSYTSFLYSDIRVETGYKSAKVKFKLKNIGQVTGSETAQIYVAKMNSSILRPVKELKGFEKVSLKPGEEKEIICGLDERAFSYYSTGAGKWVVEPGKYAICVGSSSRDIRLKDQIEFDIENEGKDELTAEQLPTYFYGTPASVPDDEFEKLLGTAIPASDFEPDQKFNIDMTLEDVKNSPTGKKYFIPLLSMACRKKLSRKEAYEEECMSEMPLHSLICMSGGKLDPETGESIVQIVNGENVGENFKKLGKLGINGIGSVFGESAGKALSKGKKLASDIIGASKKRINNNDNAEGECDVSKESNTGFNAEKIGEMIGGAGAKLEEVGKGLINKLEESGVKDKLESAGLKIGDKIDELELDKKLGDFVSKASEKAGEIGKGIKKSFGSGSADKDGE